MAADRRCAADCQRLHGYSVSRLGRGRLSSIVPGSTFGWCGGGRFRRGRTQCRLDSRPVCWGRALCWLKETLEVTVTPKSLPDLSRSAAERAKATDTCDSGSCVMADHPPGRSAERHNLVQQNAATPHSAPPVASAQNPEKQGKNGDETDWARRDSNPHPVLPEGILSPQRLPFRHSPNPCKHDTYDTSRCLSLSRARKTSVWSRPSAD